MFTFTMTSKSGCDDFICNMVYSLMYNVNNEAMDWCLTYTDKNGKDIYMQMVQEQTFLVILN